MRKNHNFLPYLILIFLLLITIGLLLYQTYFKKEKMDLQDPVVQQLYHYFEQQSNPLFTCL